MLAFEGYLYKKDRNIFKSVRWFGWSILLIKEKCQLSH